MSPPDFWPPEREELLRQLCASEQGAREIALKLGVTRDAVIGKVHRMRKQGEEIYLKGTPGRTPKDGTSTRRRQRRTRPPSDPFPGTGMKPLSTDEVNYRIKSVGNRLVHRQDNRGPDGMRCAPVFPMRRLSLLELEHGTCRWPIGEPGKPGFCFCGNDVGNPERVYCAPHHAFAHHGAKP